MNDDPPGTSPEDAAKISVHKNQFGKVRSPGLDTPVQFLKGIGPRLAALLASKNIHTVRDALFYLPRDYQDRSQIRTIASLANPASPAEGAVLLRGKVTSHGSIPIRTMRRPILEARLDDGTGQLSIKWFHYSRPFLEPKLKAGPTILAYGPVKAFGARLEMIHPEIQWDVDEADVAQGRGILPLYSETEGLNQKVIRRMILAALEIGLEKIEDDLPEPVREAQALVPTAEALRRLHVPDPKVSLDDLRGFNTREQKSLIFDELFKFQWVIGKKRRNLRAEETKGYSAEGAAQMMRELEKRLPFELTGDQKTAISKIHDDLGASKPMNRLLQGDVGCGKTLVAFCAALPVIAGGGQVAIMAPTEILAEQHLHSARRYLDGLAVELLTGSTPKARRDEILGGLVSGATSVVIGTHALIEDPVKFRELGLVVIDEQHRFGVDQRMKLRAKGRHPHILSLTATPIPRTLALTAYGDLDVSTVREMPKGRPAIHTRIFKTSERAAALSLVRLELEKGRQAYVIFPLVEESEKVDLANAIEGAETLANGPLKGFRVGLLHGRMKPQVKSQVMDSFKRGETQALVSTTVVEVGVDVPNATALMVEHAERFGLSQLHQLRGRIGRGTEASHCLLINNGAPGAAFERLRAMEQTRDGFRLAELDLRIRGPGEFLGTRQSGELQFRYADLARDQLILEAARKSAFEILAADPDLEKSEHAPLRAYMGRAGHLMASRFETA